MRPTDPLRGSATAWYRLGNRRLHRQQNEGAAACYREALARRPSLAPAWHNLGVSCQRLTRFEEALVAYRRALQFAPDDLCTLNNLGVLQREMGRLDLSLQTFDRLLAVAPEDGDGHWNRALSLLGAGRYHEGWGEYEWRFRRSRPVPVFDPGTPRWEGGPLEGRTILLCCEQAYGDAMQFVRFVPLLSDWGAKVLIRCPDRSLADLFCHAPGVAEALVAGEPLPPHDCWSPLLSLPHFMGIGPHVSPASPYLLAEGGGDPGLHGGTRLKVGLVWSGRSTDPRRACPPSALAPLAPLCGRVAFFSLQVAAPPGELDALREMLEITDLSPRLQGFMATARIMQQLDLIVSIDSAPAHLAGALGRECWLLLSATPDWRWGLEGEETPWYPTMRIFRQDGPGDWLPVMERLAGALAGRAAPGAVDRSIPLDTPDRLISLGDRLREGEQWSSALHIYRTAMQRFPELPLAPLCAGGCLLFLNRPFDAIPLFRRTIGLAPEMPDPHINLGLAALSCGDLEEGFREFEWRRHRITVPLPPLPELPDLDPSASLDGRTVLVHGEQGLGDLIQFARYLPLLAGAGAEIMISVPRPMVRLMGTVAGVTRVIPYGELLPAADYQVPLLSLPMHLRARVPHIPAPHPYLSPDPGLHDRWRTRLDPARFRVGLVWRGSDLGKSGYRRALTTDLLAPLAGVSGVALYALQLGATAAELAQLPGIVDLSGEIYDFADTAAIMSALDLVVSVDTSTAHLAGALGVRCWVPLLFAPDWRWYPLSAGGNRWYPSLVPFRQPIPGRWEPVVDAIATALQGEVLLRQGHSLGLEGRREEAIARFRRAAALPGGNAPALLNMGIYLRAEGRSIEARDALHAATDMDPDYPEAWQNLGLAHQDLGGLAEAYTCFRRALSLRPDYATARWNLGLLQLLLGEYGDGFRNFEARFTKVGAIARLHAHIPPWDGAPLAGRRILVHAEQGFGDTIQFVRYLPILTEGGAEVVLEVQDRSLAPLCGTISGPVGVIVRGEAVPPVDCQCPLLSLPRLMGTTRQTIPRKLPYLFADKEKVAAWRARLPRDGRYTVGICWKGRVTPDPRRSVPFDELTPLFELPGVRWVSLQMDPDPSACLPGDMVDLTGAIGDFSDTAALMGCLDLVVTIDSAVAHLAGALGMPGIVMLPFAPDWRWTHDQQRTPWYPTLHLLRQTQPAQWDAVIQMLSSVLLEHPVSLYAGAYGSDLITQ